MSRLSKEGAKSVSTVCARIGSHYDQYNPPICVFVVWLPEVNRFRYSVFLSHYYYIILFKMNVFNKYYSLNSSPSKKKVIGWQRENMTKIKMWDSLRTARVSPFHLYRNHYLVLFSNKNSQIINSHYLLFGLASLFCVQCQWDPKKSSTI